LQIDPLQDLIVELIEGSIRILRFSSSADAARFRTTLYKKKKEFDEIQLMIDPAYEIRSLQFKKMWMGQKEQHPESYDVELSIFNSADRKVSFQVIKPESESPPVED
jgi:hypothetical protein